jgi:hypothetical protein
LEKTQERERRKMKSDALYSVGDLVELARFGFSPQSDEDRVYGTILSVLKPTDYFVPRYRVKIQYKKSTMENPLDEFILVSHESQAITVMEYDIAGKTNE